VPIKVERLEDHRDVGSSTADLPLLELNEHALFLAVAQSFPVHEDLPAVDTFEMIDAPEEGSLAVPGWPDQPGDLTRFNHEVDATQDL
jgi:hypothetical protein